jgi:hypothetical protein
MMLETKQTFYNIFLIVHVSFLLLKPLRKLLEDLLHAPSQLKSVILKNITLLYLD